MDKGFAAASLDELAAAAGLNRPSLYAAFGDKEQLYIHTLRFYGEKSVEGLDAVLAGPGTIEQRLVRSIKAAIDLYTAPPHRPGCMIVGTAAVESPTYPKIAAAAAELLAAIEKSLERAFRSCPRDLPAGPPPRRAPALAGRLHTPRHPRAARHQGRRTAQLRRVPDPGDLPLVLLRWRRVSPD